MSRLEYNLGGIFQRLFVFSFDLKSGYHHVDIFPEHRKYLAFSWDFHTRYFQLTALPFGLSSAPFIFTKLLKPLETHWRSRGIPIAIFFDDEVGARASLGVAKYNSSLVRSDLSFSGFQIIPTSLIGSPINNFRGSTTILTLMAVLFSP